MRRTKIVCTLGPASGTLEALRAMIRAGMDVARLNFSHGAREEHIRLIDLVREAAGLEEKFVAVMVDLKGPEIRVDELADGKVVLTEKDNVMLTGEKVLGSKERLPLTYANLAEDVKPGDMVLLDDGIIALQVAEIVGKDIACRVIDGGELLSHKGLNIPGVEVGLPPVTQEDFQDILLAIEKEASFLAASFVRRASDVLEIRKVLEQNNGGEMHVIAKIENRAGVDNAEQILQTVDGLMVARGDLGVEIPPEEVPLVQKSLIKKCNRAGKPVITATHMLDSMVRNPVPTRAEASDIANAIFDGTDAIMLSGETAIGKFALESVETMARIAVRTEQALNYEAILAGRKPRPHGTITDALSHASCTIAADLKASAILTPTASGFTPRMVSKYRPHAPIVAVSSNTGALLHSCLVWGVLPVQVPLVEQTDEMFGLEIEAAVEKGLVKEGDLVVLTAGVPIGIQGTTNLLKVQVVGKAVVRGTAVGGKIAAGHARVVLDSKEAGYKVKEGDVLVVPSTDDEFLPALRKASALVAEEKGLSSHAGRAALGLGIPAVVGASGATEKIKDGEMITVDCSRSAIYRGKILK